PIHAITEARAGRVEVHVARRREHPLGHLAASHSPRSMALSRSLRTRNVRAIPWRAMRDRSELERLSRTPWRPVPADGRTRARWLALGDPQTTFDKLMEVLRLHDAVDEARGTPRLREDVGLLSIGDHFDFGAHGGPDVGHEGELFLRWLVEHPADQTIVLLG